jgi:hypothetical protein
MSIPSQLLRLKAGLLLKEGEPGPPVLVFTSTRPGNLALGNLIAMLPMMKAIDRRPNTYNTIVCSDKELIWLLYYNLPYTEIRYFVNALNYSYGTSISNFLCQDKDTVKKIIELRIPCRIGHVGLNDKYKWLYTHVRRAGDDIPEEFMNNQLVDPLGLCPQPYQLILPPIDITVPKYDILIQAHSSGNPAKDYPYYAEVIKLLKKDYKVGLIGSDAEREYCEQFKAKNLCGLYSLIETFHLINGAELVLGNDGGLLKVSDNLGIPSVQIFRKWSPVKIRCAIKQTNLIDPQPIEVVNIIKSKLK